MVATAIIGSAVIGGGASLIGSSNAADAQREAAQNATNAQMGMFHETENNLMPFIQGGQGAYADLLKYLPDLTKNFAPTMEQLQQTPGYQFTQGQGLKATQNSYAAQGLGSSGAAMKGAANYAEGLAGTTYQQQLQNYLAQNAQKYNMYTGASGIGLNAAQSLAGNATAVGGQIGSNIIGAGNATAAASIAGGNAIGNGLNGITNGLMYQQYFGNTSASNNAGNFSYSGLGDTSGFPGSWGIG